MGTWMIFIAILAAIYLLYVQISILIIENMKKRKMYLRRTNMVIIANIKSKLRENVKMMYLVTILFTAAFYTISMLYVLDINTEKSIKDQFPFNYTYTSQSNNNHEIEHVKLIEESLKEKNGYKEYKYKVRSKGEGFSKEYSLISESEYNLGLKGIGGNPISLKKNEVYILSNDPDINNISNELKTDLEKEGFKPSVVGISKQTITPKMMSPTITVLNDEMLRELEEKETYNIKKIYAYNIDNWKREGDITKKFASNIKMENEYKFGFSNANERLQVDKTINKTYLYVGFSISLIFVIAASSLIYFRLITDLEKECVKFKGIVKLGLSKKELSKIISTQNCILMFVPFLVATSLFLIGIGPLNRSMSGGSYFKVALLCSVVFFIIQMISYILVNSKYKKAVFEEVI